MTNSTTNWKQILPVPLGALACCALIWSFYLGPALDLSRQKDKELATATAKMKTEGTRFRSTLDLPANIQRAELALAAEKDKLVSGDKYLWILRALNRFRIPGKLEFPNVDQPQNSGLVMATDAPFENTSFLVRGVGSYQNIGAFIANFENEYPCLHFAKLEITRHESIEDQLLNFTFEVVGIIAPEQPSSSRELFTSID